MSLNRSSAANTGNSNGLIWQVESKIRNLTISKRSDNPKLVGTLVYQVKQLILEHPNESKVYVLKGLLHEKIKEDRAALAAYKEARERFPYCWPAYVYPAFFLQSKRRYGEVTKILRPMMALINSELTPKELLPNYNLLQQTKLWLEAAEKFLNKERKENQRLAAEARKKRGKERAENL